MPLIILRIVIWVLASLCCLSVAFSANRAFVILTSSYTPFGFLSIGILVAAIGYAVSQLRRR